MTEIDLDVDCGRKRRLPVWMLGVSAGDEQRKPEYKDEKCLPLQDQSQHEATRTKAKSATRKSGKNVLTREIKALDENCGFLLRCETREGTKKPSRRERDPNTARCSEAGLQKKKARKRNSIDEQGTEGKRAALKKQKLESNVPSSRKGLNGLLRIEESEDEMELTVEDLVSIAQKYVDADKEKPQRHAASREPRSEACISSSVFSSNNIFGESSGADGSRLQISKCTTTTSRSSQLTEASKQERESSAPETVLPTNISRTGDVAQDMLDLFLGPLLKKPPIAEERKLERTMTGELALASELSKQVRSGSVGDAADLPATKKKSSLKDKVALFLD